MASSISLYMLDVSPVMGETVYDEETRKTVNRLDLCKEYVARKIAPKIQSGRKTEHAGLITFGGYTDNPFFAAEPGLQPEAEAQDPADFLGVASIFPPQQSAPVMLSVLKAVEPGESSGNPIAALFVAREILRQHQMRTRGSKNWRREIFILTSANAKLKQGGWQEALAALVEDNIVVRIIGVGYDLRPDDEIPEEEYKSLPKTERFWRAFCKELRNQLPEETDELSLPALGSIEEALSIARGPAPDTTKSTLIASTFRLGDKQLNSDEALDFPIRYSKATSLARPMTLKRVIAKEVAKFRPQAGTSLSQVAGSSSQKFVTNAALQDPNAGVFGSGIEADITPFTRYVVMRKREDDELGAGGDADQEWIEEEVDKENLKKAYKFGSTWVPIDEDDFDQMITTKGIDVLGFMKESLMSSLVQAMVEKGAAAVVRWVFRDGAPPRVGICKAVIDVADQTEFMYWVQMPFAEDERNYLFPSLENLTSKSGKQLESHPFLPTEKQSELMDRLVEEMNLDPLGEEDETGALRPWFEPEQCYNPAIHRIKEAVYHLATTRDLNEDPVPPPHRELLKYLDPPDEVIESSSTTVEQLKHELDVRPAPAKRRRVDRRGANRQGIEGMDDEIDVDAFFAKSGSSVERSGDLSKSDGKDVKPGVGGTERRQRWKPQPGRVISNEAPIEDFEELVAGGGEVVTKAMQDMGTVIKENLAGSFSRSGFPLALDCIRVMRRQAIELEEEDLYNEFVDDLHEYVTDSAFKHKDFWKEFENARPALGKVSDDEADAVRQSMS